MKSENKTREYTIKGVILTQFEYDLYMFLKSNPKQEFSKTDLLWMHTRSVMLVPALDFMANKGLLKKIENPQRGTFRYRYTYG